MKDTRFFRQAELLLQIIPFFSNVKVFALKGGIIGGQIPAIPALELDREDTKQLPDDVDYLN